MPHTNTTKVFKIHYIPLSLKVYNQLSKYEAYKYAFQKTISQQIIKIVCSWGETFAFRSLSAVVGSFNYISFSQIYCPKFWGMECAVHEFNASLQSHNVGFLKAYLTAKLTVRKIRSTVRFLKHYYLLKWLFFVTAFEIFYSGPVWRNELNLWKMLV